MFDVAVPHTADAAGGDLKFADGICYIDCGSGEPLVLIHGVGMNKAAWYPQIAAFQRSHRVIAPDLPGHGGSALPAQDAQLRDYVRAVTGLIDRLGLSSVNLVGHSMGSLVAIGVALERKDRVVRLAALNAVYDRAPEDRSAVLARADEIADKGPMTGVDDALSRWFGAPGDGRHAELWARVRGWLQTASWEGYATAYRIFATADAAFVGRLDGLGAKALFITGEFDPHSTPAMSTRMAAAVPRGRALVVEGERHMMNLTAPAKVNDEIRRFLASPAVDA